MNRSKKLFLTASLVFVVALAIVSYDIASRTTFPGSKSQLKERIKEKYLPADSISKDSVRTVHR